MCSPISLQQILVMPVMLEWSTTALLLMPLEPSVAQLSGLSMQVRGKMGVAGALLVLCIIYIIIIYLYTRMLCCGFKYHLSNFFGSCCVVLFCLSESEFAIYYYTYLLHMQHFLDFEMVMKLRLVQSQIQHQWML